MFKAVDDLNSTRRNLMGLAELCTVMDAMRGEDIWAALYNLAAHCAEQTQEPAEGLICLIARSSRSEPIACSLSLILPLLYDYRILKPTRPAAVTQPDPRSALPCPGIRDLNLTPWISDIF